MHKRRLIPRSRMNRSSDEFPMIALTSLLDVTLTLLVMLIVASPSINNGLRVTLPHGKVQQARNVKPELVLSIDQHGSLFWNQKAVTEQQLIEEIKKDIAQYANKTIFVKGDQHVPYGGVVKIVSKIQEMKGGVEHVVFVTTPRA